MRTAAVAEAKMARGELQRLTGEDVAGPGAGVPWQENRFDLRTPVDCLLRPNDQRIPRRARGIVPARHVDLDIAEAALGEMRLQRRQRVGGRHVRDEPQIELRGGAMWQNRLPAGAGVAADQTLDVDRRT